MAALAAFMPDATSNYFRAALRGCVYAGSRTVIRRKKWASGDYRVGPISSTGSQWLLLTFLE
jgi:hypothetical protein